MTGLLDHKAPRARFARSINVERDSGSSAVDGYLPVGRAVDAIGRLAAALDRDDVEVALSITGPYGSGKSSLAIVIDALLGPARDRARRSAEELLAHTSPDALARLQRARKRLGAERHGFIRAVVTAQRESITTTVLRALSLGVERFEPPSPKASALARAARTLRKLIADDTATDRPRPDARRIREVIRQLGDIAPVLLLVDEFGKNLEAFADSHSDADLFLLQELAEWTRGVEGLPLAVVTLQHQAFDEYADGASASQRREWAKIQGRFEDIPFVDSASQTRGLVAAAFDAPSTELAQAQRGWAEEQARASSHIGLTELSALPEVLAACWPLHPVALAALPELCERYGQNERTLFSFLAGHGPRSLPTFLAQTDWRSGSPLPVVRLDYLYDYFIESAANLVAVSSNASRWLEIDTRVRDASGLSAGSLRVLKAVGLLNLVSAGGTLRASKAIVGYAAADGRPGTKTAKEVSGRLRDLERAGLITFRDFADEYRIWQGSDFDLRSAVDQARRRLRESASAEVLNAVLPLGPIVAARHSHQTGTLRAFQRAWVASTVERIDPLGTGDRADGLALYVIGDGAPTEALSRRADAKPTVFVTVDDASEVEEVAREVAALDEVLASAGELGEDWVARRELLERRVEAAAALDHAFHRSYASRSAKWTTTKSTRRRWITRAASSASSVISESCDDWYAKAPITRNDLVTRHELTSQAAKARRLLIEAMVAAPQLENLGMDGFGPEVTLYLSVLQKHGLHQQDSDGTWAFTDPYPHGDLQPVWSAQAELIQQATDRRLRVTDIYEQLAAPPFGLRAGVAPIILTAELILRGEEIALYEHGTFRAALSDDVMERLLRNPGNFEVKYYASRSGVRADFLTRLADELGIGASRSSRSGRVGSVLAVVSHLVGSVNALPEHIKRTRRLSDDALNIRHALLTATEPDALLFVDLPTAFGLPAIPARGAYDDGALDVVCERLRSVLDELRSAYSGLLRAIETALRDDVGSTAAPLREGLAARARDLSGKIIDRGVQRLAVALAADIPDDDGWLAYIAMNMSGVPPEGWSDEDRDRFFLSLADAGGTFRRLHALNANLDARADGFDAYRSAFTASDGREVVHVVALDANIRELGLPVAERAVHDLATQHGISLAEARSLLVGLLGEVDLADRVAPSETSAEHETYGGVVTESRQ